MPELPEVEVTRRGIAAPLRGARVLAVRQGKPLRWPLGTDPTALIGATLGAAERRGKYLWLPLQRPDGGLLLHLGMSGSLALLRGAIPPAQPHDHFDLVTDRGTLRLTDPRRFGAVVWSPSLHEGAAGKLTARLGAEPFDPALTAPAFLEALRRRRGPIKAVLLGGDVVVGAGNIYACEALFGARIDPRTPACRLSAQRADRLLLALRETLHSALDLGGSTLRDFRSVHGVDGSFQARAAVYGRAEQPCPRCGAAIRRIVQGQRSTFFCAGCQRR